MALNGKFKTKIWETAIKRSLVKKSPKLNPIYDGLLGDEKEWKKAKYKIMWVLKEPYDDFTEIKKQPCGGDWSFYDEIAEADVKDDNYFPFGKKRKSKNTWLNMLYVSYGILEEKEDLKNEFCEAENKQDDLDILKKIAVINMSKMPGPIKTINSELQKKFLFWKDVVIEQIHSYNPNIIIFGGTFEFFKEEEKNLGLKSNQSPCFEEYESNKHKSIIYKTKNAILIDTFHPMRINHKCANLILKGIKDIKRNK